MIENHDPLSLAHSALPGTLMMVFRESRLREIGMLSYHNERKTFTVRAVMTGRSQATNCNLEDVVTCEADTQIVVTDGGFPTFKYYSNGRAVLFDLICDYDQRLTHIQTYVSARRPELALGYARAAISQFIDTLAMYWEYPLAIQRLEVMSLDDDGVLAFQITIPNKVTTLLPRFHSLRAGGPFLHTEAVYREAITFQPLL